MHYAKSIVHAEAESIISLPDEEHARVRQLLAPFFSERALKQQEPLFLRYADLLANKLIEFNEKPSDVTVMMNLTTFDIMAELAFGESLSLLESGKYTDWVHHLITAIKGLPIVQIIQYYPWMNTLFKTFEPKWIEESRVATMKYAADRVDKRLEKGSSVYSSAHAQRVKNKYH